MRCWGITKKRKFCKLNCKFLFCRYHWWQPLLLLFVTFPSILSSYLGIYRDGIEPKLIDNQAECYDLEAYNFNISNGTNLIYDIVVLPLFNYDSEETSGLGVKIKERLEELKTEDTLKLNVEYLPIKKNNNFDSHTAQKILKQYDFDLLIYGDFIKGNCNLSNKICLNFLTKGENGASIASVRRGVNNYLDADVYDIMEGKLQESFENIIYIFNSFIASHEKKFERAIRLISKTENDIQDPYIEYHKGNLFWSIRKYELSSESFELSGDFFLENGDSISAYQIYVISGEAIRNIGDYQKSLNSYSKAHEIVKNKSNEWKILYLSSLRNMAIAYSELKDDEKSKKYSIELLDTLNRWKDPNLTYYKCYPYLNISLIDIENVDKFDSVKIDSIMQCFLKGKSICHNLIVDSLANLKKGCLQNIGLFYMKTQEWEEAEKSFNAAINLSKGTFDEKKIFNIFLMYKKAMAIAQQKRYDEALEIIDSALSFSKETYGYNKFEEHLLNIKKQIVEFKKSGSTK